MQILAVSMNDILLLLFAGMLAGSMNALAGGGSFVSLPALISVGGPSVAANATSTFSLFPGGLASSWVYRDGFGNVCGVPVLPIAFATVLGGLCGSMLLLLTPSSIFDAILPWLLLLNLSRQKRLHMEMPVWLCGIPPGSLFPIPPPIYLSIPDPLR